MSKLSMQNCDPRPNPKSLPSVNLWSVKVGVVDEGRARARGRALRRPGEQHDTVHVRTGDGLTGSPHTVVKPSWGSLSGTQSESIAASGLGPPQLLATSEPTSAAAWCLHSTCCVRWETGAVKDPRANLRNCKNKGRGGRSVTQPPRRPGS